MIIDAGHINVDSQLADKDVVNDIKNKDIQKYSKQDAITLEELMYDKFNLQLSQTKVLIGSNTEECLWQLQGHPPRNGVDARFIERIDMNFLIELCILPGKTEFTKFKVSGHLPLLSINLSDSKYKILMRIVDFIVPSSDNSSSIDQSQATKRPQLQKSSHASTDNIISEHYWGLRDNQALLIDDSSDLASIGSRPDTPTTTVSQSASIASSEVEQFKLTFKVDKVSASIHETSTVNTTKEILLCEVLLESFELEVLTRPDDLLVDVSLKAVSVADEMEHEGDFHYLVTSDIIDRKNAFGRTNDKNLVNIKYRKASRDHPRFHDIYQSYDQTVDVVLSTLTVVVTRKSLLRIYNWIMNTFTAPPAAATANIDAKAGKEVFDGDVFYDDVSSLDNHSVLSESLHMPKISIKPTSTVSADNSNSNSNRMKVAIHMDSVNIILNNEGKRLGTGELSFGDIIIMLEPNTIEVDGKFGNFTLSDDTVVNETNNNSVQTFNTSSISETYIISIVGDELADFTYKTYDPKASEYPGYNQKFDLKMGAIQLLVTESVKPTLNFLQEFLEMKNVYDAARNAAVETAQQIQEGGGNNRFHFNIMVKSPVLVFPVGENKKTDTLIANLGEIRANNSFIEVHRRDLKNVPQSVMVPVTHINCGLYDISLFSTAVTHDNTGNINKHVLPIIDNLDIVFDIQNPENPNEAVGPGSQILGNISDVRMALTERQYKSLLETWEFIQKEFLSAAPNAKDSTSNTTEETLNANNNLTTSSSQSQTSTTSPQADVPSIKEVANKINLDLVVKLNTVYLEILSGEDSKVDDKDKHMLSKLAFDGICLKLQNMSNESMLMEVGIQSVSFADTRAQSKSKFREILPANKLDGPQFQFKLWSYKDEGTPVMDMKITVDSPKIILSLDYLFLLKDFFLSPFTVIEPTEAQKYAQSYGQDTDKKESDIKQLQSQNQAPPTAIRYNINIIDLGVLCLANPETSASEAIILSFNQLTIIQQTNLEVHLDGIGMILCRMDNIAESTMHFVEEFNVLLSMETASTSTVHHLTTIKLKVEPIILRLSYQDAMLISNIANKVIALMGTSDQNTEPKPTLSESISDIESVTSDALLLGNQNEDYLQVPGSSVSLVRTEKPKGIEPFIVMSKESVSFFFQVIISKYSSLCLYIYIVICFI
jgi:vacuolar protein sorting-associated protein 13A/C